MIWGIDCHGGDCAVPDWDVTHARFLSDEEMFAVAATLGSAEQLVRAVPSSTCAHPFWIRRRHPAYSPMGSSARSLDERARIVEPVKRDGRLIYTFRAADERLVRAEIALDGRSSRCTIEPPRVDDGGPVLTMPSDSAVRPPSTPTRRRRPSRYAYSAATPHAYTVSMEPS